MIPMGFRITDDAADFLKRRRDSTGLAEDHGIRIYRHAADGEGEAPRLVMRFTDSPEDGDRRVEHRGIVFYVDPDIAGEIEDLVIDFEEQATAPPAPPALHVRTG
jgi:Fe-S cluster assembly iron-binding protein IscA